MTLRKLLWIVTLIYAIAYVTGHQVKHEVSATESNADSSIPVADVLLQPSQRWKTSRQELVKLLERLKRYIRKAFKLCAAKMEKQLADNAAAHPFENFQNAELFNTPRGSYQFRVPPPERQPRFQQQLLYKNKGNYAGSWLSPSSGYSMQPFSARPSVAFNRAGAFLDSMQPPAQREIARSVTNAVFSGQIPFESLLELQNRPPSRSLYQPSPTPLPIQQSEQKNVTPVSPPMISTSSSDTNMATIENASSSQLKEINVLPNGPLSGFL